MFDAFQAASQSIYTRETSAMATLCEFNWRRLTKHSPKTFKRTKTQRCFSELKHLHLLPGKSLFTNAEDEE